MFRNGECDIPVADLESAYYLVLLIVLLKKW